MRLLLAAAVFLHSAQAADVGMNQPCNKELDGLLATDPSGNPNTFLSCVGVGVGNIGFWERKVCPNDMVFDFINQQCKAKRKKSRKQQTLNIAILNNSCAQGETCIGGTVCDLDTLRCLCPFGTMPQVETLSCIKNDVSPAFNFNSFNFESGFNTGDFFRPNPKAATAYPSYNNRGNQEQGYSGSSSSWQPFPGQLPSEFKPNHNQFNFNVFTTTAPAPTTQKVPILAYPGQSCRNDEVCSGGSICTLPIGLCLCPGELEARDGECVLPASAAGIQISKVGIGALCSELAECDHGSSCIMGRCACVAPLLQHEGKCVLRQESKKVGPGELCDNGEICIKGSVCDNVIPVCVCPTDTDLRDGECIRVAPKTAAPRPATYIPAMTAPPPTARPQPPPQPQPTQAPFTHPAPTYVPPTQPVQTYRPATPPPAPAPSTVNYQSFSPPPMRPTIKPNHMKINLGGSKQAGVGVRCALNTDCMIGAYCNGNTNPPSCQCLSTHVNIEGRCEKIVYPGQIGCRSDLQCSSAYTGTTCIDRVCVCPEGNKAVDQTCVPGPCNPACVVPFQCVNSECLLISKNRTVREISRDISALVCYPGARLCSHGDGVCLEGQCRCLKGWQPRDGRCKPLEVPVGAKCTSQEVVCQEDAVCDGGVCRCRYPGKCSPPVGRSPTACSLDTDCKGGETCTAGKCLCPEGSDCSQSSPVYKSLNSACWGQDRCAGGSVCKDSVCQCTDGSTEQYGRCQQQPGGRCSAGQTCSSGAICDFGLCRCLDGYSLSNGICTLLASMPGKSCQLGQKCLHGSACRFGVCMCIGKTIALGDRCVKRQELAVKVAEVLPGTIKGPGMECNFRDICAGGSKCTNKMCQCEDHEVIIDEQCVGNTEQAVEVVEKLNIAAPGQPCDAKTNCSGTSLCIDKICQCEEGKVSEEGSCRPAPSASPPKKSGKDPNQPGSLCTLTMECPFRTECVRGVCRCKKGETIVDGACRSAIHQVLPGGRCDPRNGYDCVGEAHCIYGTCTCVRQLINNGKQCVSATEITIIPIGKRCTPELICAGNSRCVNGICRCRDDEVPDVNGKCAKKSQVYPVYNKFIGSTTTIPLDKFQNKIDEIEELELEIKNNPQASLGENQPNSITLQVIYGAPCQNNQDCPENAFCSYGQCQCIPGYRATGGYCERILKAGEACQSTNQCEVNAFCLNGKCICSSKDGLTCSSPALRRPGEECGDGMICAYNSYCGIMSGVCECPSGMSTQDAACQQTAGKPGMACVTSRNCHKFSYCDNGYCLCKTGYDLIEGFCVPYGGNKPKSGEYGGPELPPNRNDGPQSPMQERIRTESFMKLNPGGQTAGNDAGTAYEFGPGRVNPGYGNENPGSGFQGQWTENSPSFGSNTQENFNSQPFSNNQNFGGNNQNFGANQEPNFQPHSYNGGPRQPTRGGYDTQTAAPLFQSGPFHKYPQASQEEPMTQQPQMFSTPPMKIVIPSGASPELFQAAVPAPFIFQPPFPFARASNTKSGDVPAPSTTTARPTFAVPAITKVKVAMPGEYCADGALCLGNSVCRGQFCRCPNGSSAENGICIQRKKFHSPPKKLNNEVADDEHQEERQFSAPLENCQNFEFCTAGSECLNINGMGLICQCPVGKIFLDEECVDNPRNVELAGIGDSCSGGEICLGGSTCLKEICVCGEGKREILGICVATAQPGDDCGKGEICVDGSICVGELRTCVCPPGRVSKAGRCVEDLENLSSTTGAANPGEECSRQVICMDNSFCDGLGKCRCLPKFHNVKGRCVPASMVRELGEACAPGTICVSGACTSAVCTCRPGQLEIDGNCVEVPKSVHRRPARAICKSDEDCQERYNCTQSLCTCEGDSKECMNFLLQDNDAECQADSDCPKKSTCQEGMCICDDGYRREMDHCVERHPENREHSPLWAQIFGKSTVTQEQLEEKEEQEEEASKEVWTHIPEAPENQESPKKNVPWKETLPVATISWENPYYQTTTPLSLLEFRSLDMGAITLSQKIPTVTLAKVPFLKTKITPSKPEKNTKPKLRSFNVAPGASCMGKRKCAEGSICFDHYCVCGYEDQPVNDECVPRDQMVRFGHRCTASQRCHEGLVCVFNKCQCPLGVESCNPNEPVTSPPGGSCTEARECTGGSVCREGWCICPDPTMIVQKGICIQSGPRPTLPSRTVPVYTTPSPAYTPAAAPVYHTAANPAAGRTFNALPNPQQQSRKRTPGSQCGPLDTCVGGSTCVESLCVCPAGMQPSMNGRCEPAPSTSPSIFVPSWEPRLPSTPDFIELPPAGGDLPTTTPHASSILITTSNQHRISGNSQNECEAIGLFCRGNTICVNKSCQCPEGHILHNDGCVPPTETKRRKSRGKARHQVVAASQYSRPGESCSLGQVCTGGSTCPKDTQLCTCPPEKPLIIKDYCHPEVPARRQAVAGESCDANTDCTNGSACHSGQCRCPPQYVAFSGHCVHMPMQTTPAMKMVAKPLESCDDGEVCTGGSSCDEDTGMCMCPAGQVAFGEQCRHPPTVAPRTTTTVPTRPPPVIITTPAPRAECSNDAHCTPGKTCIAGKCRCRPGTMDNGGICEPIEARKPLKYGQPCDHLRDRCTNGAKCLDNVCKCTPGFVLSPAGWCERFHFQLTTTMKPKTFNALPAAPEKMTESVLPARPAWNVPVEPATTRQPQTPQSINFHATLATQAPYTPPPRPPVMVTLPPTVATVPPIRETYPPPTQQTYPPPAPLAPVPTQPPVQVLPADNSGPRIRGRVAGTSCRDTDICLHGSSCIHGRCQCRPPLVARNGHCVKLHLAAPGEPCSKGEQCTGGSICDNDQEMCVCASRHTIVDGVCKSKDAALFVPPGSQCGGAQVCSGGSYCASGTCLCDSNHYAEDGYCRHIASQSSEIDHETGGPLRFSAMLSPRAPATVCDPEKCRLPDCFCSVTGRIPPISDPIVDVPQFVVLTFDDAVNGRTLPDYLTLFADQRYRNPNGCPVKATFFVSHEWTNYDAVQWLADQDMEVASNSISHTNMAGENASRWLNEMDGQRRILAKFGNIPEEKIVGMRAPQLSAGGDAQFEMMSRAGFLYDNTLSANPGIHGEPYWPQTLDYAVPWNCYEENCPSSSFPGLWEVPLNQFYGAYVRQIDSYRRSSMIRAAVDLNNTIEELTNMLLTNFDRAYTSNKAPFVLSLNADFLQLNGRNEGMAALQKFLDEIMQHKDVFLVSLHQLIEWMQNPLPMTMIHKSDPLRCDRARFSSNPRNACTQPNKCMYRTPAMTSYEHQFKTCAPCPDVFPWIHNPTGNIR